MTDQNKTKLINLIKIKCYINSSDEAINTRLENILEDSIIKIANLIGMSNDMRDKYDFSKPSLERDLLKNYCWYAWNDSEPEFKNNYADDIMVLRSKYEEKDEQEKS